MAENLLLKWGGLKGWNLETDKSKDALKRYAEFGLSMSCAMQHDTPEQKERLCDLIDSVDGEIRNDWTGEIMSKDEAKQYVLRSGKQ